MATTEPTEARTALVAVTAASAAEMTEVAQEDSSLDTLLATAPVVVSRWMDASAELALDWYEELRTASPAPSGFTPSPVTNLNVPRIGNYVGWAVRTTEADVAKLLLDAEREAELLLERLLPAIEKEVASAFWDSMTENTQKDDAAVGWQRFARPNGCPFCRMLAGRGAVYSKETARFASHERCKCVVRPVFEGQDLGPEASVMQYLASDRKRTPEQQYALKEYLHKHYGAPKPRPLKGDGESIESLLAKGRAKNAPRVEALDNLLAGLT